MKLDIKSIGKIRYQKGDGIFLFLSIIFALFGTTSTLIYYILPSSKYQGILAISVLLIEIYLLIFVDKIRFYKSEGIYLIILLLLLFFAVFRNGWNTVAITMYAASIIFCFLAFTNMPMAKVAKMIITLFLFMDIVYAVFTVLSFLSPSLYLNHIVNLFPANKAKLIKLYNQGSISGLTSHYSTNGMFLATGLVISAAKYNSNKQRKNLALIILFLITLLMTGKRAHVLFGVAAIFVLYFYSQSNEKAINKWAKTLGIILFVGCAGFIVISAFPGLAGMFIRFRDTLEGGDVSNGRFELWSLAVDAFMENPVFGIGWKQYRNIVSPLFSTKTAFDTHNVYLQLLCETGIIGFTIYLIWFVEIFGMTVRLFKKISMNKSNLVEQNYLVGFSLIYQTFFFLYCFTGNPLYEMYMYIPYFLSCSVTLYYTHNMVKYERSQRCPKSV